MGLKSLLVSKGSLSKMKGLTAMVPMWPRMMVWPSVEAAHSCIAMLPLAPGLFSTNTVWPRLLVSSLAAERATISELPPGAKGTSRRIGLLGQPACAWAELSSPGKAETAASAPLALRPNCKCAAARVRVFHLDVPRIVVVCLVVVPI